MKKPVNDSIHPGSLEMRSTPGNGSFSISDFFASLRLCGKTIINEYLRRSSRKGAKTRSRPVLLRPDLFRLPTNLFLPMRPFLVGIHRVFGVDYPLFRHLSQNRVDRSPKKKGEARDVHPQHQDDHGTE